MWTQWATYIGTWQRNQKTDQLSREQGSRSRLVRLLAGVGAVPSYTILGQPHFVECCYKVRFLNAIVREKGFVPSSSGGVT